MTEEGRPDLVARAVTLVVSVVYFGAGAVLVGVAVGMLLVRLFPAGVPPLPSFRVLVPVRAPSLGLDLLSHGVEGVGLEGARAYVRFPLELAPTWLVAVWWGEIVVFGGMLLGVLRNVRKVFQRVRDGVPFDGANALRLRWVGILLLCFGLGSTVDQYWMSAAVIRFLANDSAELRPALDVHWAILIVGLAVAALAEVFRRGATLEEEQSLVV